MIEIRTLRGWPMTERDHRLPRTMLLLTTSTTTQLPTMEYIMKEEESAQGPQDIPAPW